MSDQTYEISESDAKQRIGREKGSTVTNREWEMYPTIFNLPGKKDTEYWRARIILDVGSGIKTDMPTRIFPGAKICAIDPEFEFEKNDSRITRNTADEKRQGVAQEIPYDDNTFDHVLSSHAVPQHISPTEMAKSVSEMIRVMKPTGDIRLAPCVELDLNLKELQIAGFIVDFTQQTTEGSLAVIQLPEEVRNEQDPSLQLQMKVEMWKKYHDSVLPKDSVRDDFDSQKYTEAFLEKKKSV